MTTPATTPINLEDLSAFFPADSIEWKPLRRSGDGKRALAAAYLTNRAIMDRLDAVCGRAGWTNTFQPGPDGGVLCGLSILADGQWITKWDGAENTDIEPVKGGLSSSMRRAAVQWGIGRYLYDLPMQWIPIDERGHFQRQPRIDPLFLPPDAPSGDGAVAITAAPDVDVDVTPSPPSTLSSDVASDPPERTPRLKQAREPKDPYRPAKPKRPDASQYFLPDDLPF